MRVDQGAPLLRQVKVRLDFTGTASRPMLFQALRLNEIILFRQATANGIFPHTGRTKVYSFQSSYRENGTKQFLKMATALTVVQTPKLCNESGPDVMTCVSCACVHLSFA